MKIRECLLATHTACGRKSQANVCGCLEVLCLYQYSVLPQGKIFRISKVLKSLDREGFASTIAN
jgi:hypothetical protein